MFDFCAGGGAIEVDDEIAECVAGVVGAVFYGFDRLGAIDGIMVLLQGLDQPGAARMNDEADVIVGGAQSSAHGFDSGAEVEAS